ncbi:MAG: hypothetical protein M1838_004949 [Thelocarpon superellum]|nr:MAG: hypothetical protein M1838_004949 [Thelocarpon superellum]
MVAITELPPPPAAAPTFSVSHQKVKLDIDFATRTVKGRTEITILPHTKDLKVIRLNCRQSILTRLNVNSKGAVVKYDEPYGRFHIHSAATAHQHHQLRQKLLPQLKEPPEEELIIHLPKTLTIEEAWEPKISVLAKHDAAETGHVTPGSAIKSAEDPGSRYVPLTMIIEFRIDHLRDGLQFVGWEEGDRRYPHVFTSNTTRPGAACSIFPCVDQPGARCTWEISITCPRSLGEATRRRHGRENGVKAGHDDGGEVARTDDEGAMEMTVVCTGELTDEVVDPDDPGKKTVSFLCATAVAPPHVGFAVGPFEHVALSDFRETDEDDKLGTNAIQVHGYCLPGRSAQVQSTCMPMAKAIDHFTLTYGSYPFTNYNVCFVDDLIEDTVETAALSLCSNRLLFPDEIVEPLDEVTRKVVYSLASQWSGINIIPAEPTDAWVVVGVAHFVTDLFMKKLCGNNEYRFRQKTLADRICELDVGRPSIHALGGLRALDPAEGHFLSLKAPVVLFILDRRLAKASGSSGLPRIISRIFLNAKVGELPNGALTTAHFLRTCEKLGHTKLDAFFDQWVFGAGCPRFLVTQRFNKKKLVVEMLIRQVQGDRVVSQDLAVDTFMRDVREQAQDVEAPEVQRAFTGPMTIRIHEADGTPYEHIVEIKDNNTKFEIPYNTKYKRLKRSRRQKERAVANPGLEATLDAPEDALLYCLGDVLQSDEEMAEWRLADWSKDDEEKMSQESYEWIRMDADFEWICKTSLGMPGYMYLSQLQQDRDVVAQYESVQYIATQRETPLVSTILVRTLMDRRYFHGIRTAAALALAKTATAELDWLGLYHLERAFQECFCYPNTPLTRPNDFSDRAAYYIQCAIPQAMAKIRDHHGKAPIRAKRFVYEKLKFNDNAGNEYSDCHYVAGLMTALSEALITRGGLDGLAFSTDEDEEEEKEEHERFLHMAMEEMERYSRMDEWIGSYHNLYSVTALRCKERLMQAKVISLDALPFFQYTRDGGYELLRAEAFAILVRLGLLTNPAFAKYFLTVLHADPSPWIRGQLRQVLTQGIAAIALGRGMTEGAEPTEARQDGLIIEQDASATAARQADLSRTQTVPGAVAALQKLVEDDEGLARGLWAATTSPNIGLWEMRDLLEICGLLYKPETSMLVVMKYPRYWRVTNDKGLLHFTKTGSVRIKPLAPDPVSEAKAKSSASASTPLASTGPKLIFKKKMAEKGNEKPPAQSAVSPPPPPPKQAEGAERKLTIKLKLPGGGA